MKPSGVNVIFLGFLLSPFWPLGFSADKVGDTLEAESVQQDQSPHPIAEGTNQLILRFENNQQNLVLRKKLTDR